MDRKILGEAKYIRQGGPGSRFYFKPMIINKEISRANSVIFKYLKDDKGGLLRVHSNADKISPPKIDTPFPNKVEPLVQLNFFENSKQRTRDPDENDRDLSPMSRISKRFYSKYMVNPLNTTMSIRAQKMR